MGVCHIFSPPHFSSCYVVLLFYRCAGEKSGFLNERAVIIAHITAPLLIFVAYAQSVRLGRLKYEKCHIAPVEKHPPVKCLPQNLNMDSVDPNPPFSQLLSISFSHLNVSLEG